jgi:proline dehydrogenase
MSVMRSVFLWASTNVWMREHAMRRAFVRRSVSKFMPGETVEDAIEAAKALVPRRINTILTRLGENISHIKEADDVAAHYMKVIGLVKAAGLDAQISVKPTQLGFDQDMEVCFRHLAALADAAVAAGNFLWLDMESSPYVDGTLALYKRLRERTPKVGLAIQAYLHRTAQDLEPLIAMGAAIRLVKGAYLEPPTVAFPNKSDVDANYFTLASRLLQDDAERHVAPSRYEFAMLYGIQTARQVELAKAGAAVRCLISYGEYWFPWYMRRLGERPANVWFVVKNVFG